MFGFFKKKKKTSDAHYMYQRFNELKEIVLKAPPHGELALSIVMALTWKIFLAEFETSDKFISNSKKIQMEYFEKRLVYQKKLASEDQSVDLLACELFNIYLAALIAEDTAFEKQVIDLLDPITRKGWNLAI